jgi:thiol-disulfide isomerase/thioredoxin
MNLKKSDCNVLRRPVSPIIELMSEMNSNFQITQLFQRSGRFILFIAFFSLVLFLMACAMADIPNLLKIAPPTLTLESLDGQKISLSQYKGNVVLINFWATWCPPCQKEIPALEAAYQEYKDRGFVILGVDVGESRQAVETFASKMGISYPVLLDEQDQWMKRYDGLGLPMSVIIKRDGQIGEKHLGELTQEELAGLLENYLSTP